MRVEFFIYNWVLVVSGLKFKVNPNICKLRMDKVLHELLWVPELLTILQNPTVIANYHSPCSGTLKNCLRLTKKTWDNQMVSSA
jgi:hypothetical protein